MIAAALLALALAPAGEGGDPRPSLIEPQLEHRFADALALADGALAEGGDAAAALGLDYLRGHLLELLGRRGEAATAFARAMVATPQLEMHSRFRLAVEQERFGHPEVAAGLVATVVNGAPASPLLDVATRLFVRTLGAGGDCRLLGGIDRARLAAHNRRLLELAAADCLRGDDPAQAQEPYLRLLRENREDDAARWAAARLADLAGGEPETGAALQLGLTFHWHRQFDRSVAYLERATAALAARHLGGDSFDAAYALVRGRFWQEDYAAAAAGFADLAGRTSDRRRQALALHQQARSEELAGRQAAAVATFRRAYLADPLGRLADAALIAALRLHWLAGDEAGADEIYALLTGRRQWIPTASRASLFLAASDLARGRRDRAGRWLELAERAGRTVELEVAYWRGRLAELDAEPAAAAGQYLRVTQRDLFHPLAEDARRRLTQQHLAGAARAAGLRLAESPRPEDWYGAWILLGEDSAAGRAALERLRARLAADRSAGGGGHLTPVPVDRWPLWRSPPRDAEEMLLGLGIVSEGAPAVTRLFPLADPPLAFTGSVLLARAGEVHRAIARADQLYRRQGRQQPPLVPVELRRLLYPMAYSELVVAESLRRGVDPYLLAAIIREESLFDPEALSAASARGLTQFVAPTAADLGRRIGLGEVAADDLYRPEVAIALGAAYLRELIERFDGATVAAVASYNAGAPQAEVWRGYCLSTDPAEYFSKVSFAETRRYLEKVLRSWGQYRDLYRRSG